jgi:hypothetical protein
MGAHLLDMAVSTAMGGDGADGKGVCTLLVDVLIDVPPLPATEAGAYWAGEGDIAQL